MVDARRGSRDAAVPAGAAPSRREFLHAAGGALLTAAAVASPAAGPAAGSAGGAVGSGDGSGVSSAAGSPAGGATTEPAPRPDDERAVGGRLVASTWNFGLAANAVAWQALAGGCAHPLDACEAGVRVPEADPDVTSVGLGGLPAADGVVELDAAVMRGDTLGCGGVASLRGVLHPVSVARAVMERTPHVLLVGDGALRFARALGVPEQDLLTPGAREAWERWRAGRSEHLEPWERAMQDAAPVAPAAPGQAAAPGRPAADHDTIGMIALDGGRFATAVTTSGLAFKVPGRVGDSPIIGAGSYCDDDVGAAVSTGIGEEVIRTGGCVSIVESMRRGLTPRRAVSEVLRRIRRAMAAGGRSGQVAFLVVSRGGEVFGGALQPGFQYALTDAGGSRLLDGEVVP